jgi:hypothetical protein
MKANRQRADKLTLVFDQFAAAGASLDQVRAIFAASGFTVLALADIARE